MKASARHLTLGLAVTGLIVWGTTVVPGSARAVTGAVPTPTAPLALGSGSPGGLPVAQAQATQTRQPAEWTVLIYLHADHNLQANSVADIDEMKKAGVVPSTPTAAGKVNVVLQYDRQGRGVGVDQGITREVVNGDHTDLLASYNDDDVDSDDPATVRDFLDWGLKTFPAKHHAVIMWDHGGQWDGGFGGDENRPGDKEKGSLTPIGVETAIETALKANGLAQLDWLSYDTCLMGGIELLLQHAPVARLYTGNPELDYGDGLDYENTLKLLSDQPDLSTADLARREADIWAAHHNTSESDLAYRAHTSIDTDPAKLQRLSDAWKSFSAAVTTNTAVLAARTKALEYNFSFDASDVSADRAYVDLGDFAAQIAATGQAASQAAALEAAIKDVVLAKVLGSRNSRGTGLSVWLPNKRAGLGTDLEDLPKYRELSASRGTADAWASFLGGAPASGGASPTSFLGVVAGNTTPPNVRGGTASTASTASGGDTVSFSSDDGSEDDVVDRTILLARPESASRWVVYGTLDRSEGDEGDFSATWDEGWYRLGNKDGSTLVSAFEEEDEDPILYVAGRYTFSGRTSKVELILDAKSGAVVDLLDTSGLSPRSIPFVTGGRFEPLRRLYNPQTQKFSEEPTGVFLTTTAAEDGGLNASRRRVDPGNYAALAVVEDVVGNVGFGSQPLEVK